MKKVYFFLLLSFLFFSCQNEQYGDRLIVPGERVGLIDKNKSMDDLIELYGKKNTKKKSIGVGEGEEKPGLVIFPNTSDEIEVVWNKKKDPNPAFIRIGQENTAWKTASGISIGTTLNQLEEINGRPFTFYGFEWDYAGLVTDWNGGELEGLVIALMPQNFNALDDQVMGDIELQSDLPMVQAIDPVVGSIVISFP